MRHSLSQVVPPRRRKRTASTQTIGSQFNARADLPRQNGAEFKSPTGNQDGVSVYDSRESYSFRDETVKERSVIPYLNDIPVALPPHGNLNPSPR